VVEKENQSLDVSHVCVGLDCRLNKIFNKVSLHVKSKERTSAVRCCLHYAQANSR